jgi:8-oxo-dGTP diphosphatase
VGHHPDEGQESIQWLELEKLMDYRLYPLSMREHFVQIDAATTTPVYLGDIN